MRPGRDYVAALYRQGWHFFDRPVVDAVFGDNAEHPPLGRWLLGVASTMAQPAEIELLGVGPVGTYVVAARLAPALAFAILVGLVTHTAARRYGRGAGAVGGASLLAMPRVFAHAHLAALDTFPEPVLGQHPSLALDRALPAPAAVFRVGGGGVPAPIKPALSEPRSAWFLLPIVLIWAWACLGVRRGLVGLGTLGSDRVRLFLGRVAGSPMRHLGQASAVLGDRCPPRRAAGPVFWDSLFRSRRSLALPLAVLRGDRAGGSAGARRWVPNKAWCLP